jgi:carboxypeptidase Q
MIVSQEVASQLFAECLGKSQTLNELQWLCDNVGGRTSGSESGRRGEEWAFGLLGRWGIAEIRYEEFPVSVWERGTLEAIVKSPTFWKLTALAHGNCPRFAEMQADVIELGHGERVDYEMARAGTLGKIVLCDEGFTEGKRKLHRTEKLWLAEEFGAVGLMIMSSASGGLPRTGVCYHGEAPIPSIGISLEDGERLRRLIQSGVTPTVSIRMRNEFGQGTARNVVADIRGADIPDEIVLAGAHLDSWDVAQGATDNGLGSAIVLETARVLSLLPERPKRTLRFAIWAAEETGLNGSKEYCRKHGNELLDHIAVMNFDMTGDPYGYWVPGRKNGRTILAELVTQLATVGMKDKFDFLAALHSDHQPFMLAGVPIVMLMSSLDPEAKRYYHSVGDTFEKISLPAFCRATCVAAHTLWALANVEERPLHHLDPTGVLEMIDEANLFDALKAEEYDGPAMREGRG